MSDGIIIPEAGKAQQDLRDIETAKTIADHLEKHYPGYMWAVNASADKGIVTVLSLRLSGQYGYTLLYSDFVNDPSLKKVTMAGGEILERFRVRIGQVNNDQLEGMKQVAGQYAFDYHAMANQTKITDAVRMRWDYFKN